jgi:nicotinamide-nucleotide amidase
MGNVALINTGTELLIGRVANTHQQFLCRQLTDLGFAVLHQCTVPDLGEPIVAAVEQVLPWADLIITTGGLGPTSDDLTREKIAALFGRPLREDPGIWSEIQRFFALRNKPAPPMTRVQALVPEGASVFRNDHGTAPGLAIPTGRRAGQWLIMLPGPPRELVPMFEHETKPFLRQHYSLAPTFTKSFRTTGAGESTLQELVEPHLTDLKQVEIGYCAGLGEVEVRIKATGPEAAEQFSRAEAIVRKELTPFCFGCDDESLESVVISLLRQRGKRLVTAESCTGGLLSHRLTNVPGASEVFLHGFVTYSNGAKEKWLRVNSATLQQFGAVSSETAKEMAEGARQNTEADFAVSITGIAGPGGGSEAKPVGTVFIGVSDRTGTEVVRQLNPYDRQTFKEVTIRQALNFLRQRIVKSVN